MIVKQAIFDTTGTIIVQTDYEVRVKLLEMVAIEKEFVDGMLSK